MSMKSLSAKLTFRMDTGKVKDGKAVYANQSVDRIRSDASEDTLASTADALKGLIEPTVERTTFTRVDLVEQD